MSTPPLSNNDNDASGNANDASTSTLSPSINPEPLSQNQEGPSASSPSTSRHSPPPFLSFLIGTPGPSNPHLHTPSPIPPNVDDTAAQASENALETAPTPSNQPTNPTPGGINTNNAPNAGTTSMFWSFTIRPNENDGPGPPNPPNPNPLGENNTTSNNGTEGQPPSQRIAPPWLFPPFFNFFMPIRPEPQPNPEKAAELLRSLPTVGKNLLKRVDRIVAAQDNDITLDEGEKGWKCGICLEGCDFEELGSKSKIIEDNEGNKEEKEEASQEGNQEEVKGKDEQENKEEINDMQVDDSDEAKKKKEEDKEKEKEKKNNTGVKALPCNHLFHEDCLQPWFTTKHTCPSCRLDLDPLQTLHSPSPRPNTLRPTATGSDRRSPHPYARDRPPNPAPETNTTDASTTTENASASVPAPTPAHAPAHGGGNGGEEFHRLFSSGPGGIPSVGISGNGNPNQDGPSITFIFPGTPPEGFMAGLPFFPPPPHRPSEVPTNPPATTSTGTEQTNIPTAPTPQGEALDPTVPAPSTPGSVFDVPTFFSSPLPMGSRASPSPMPDFLPPIIPFSPPRPASTIAPQAETSTPSGPTPSATNQPVPTDGSSTTTGPGNGPEDRPRPERRPHITIIRTSSPSPAPGFGAGGLNPPGGSLGLGLGNLPLPPFLFSNLPPPNFNSGRTPPAEPNQNNNNDETGNNGNERPSPARNPTPFVPQTLESWAEEKEKSLGWRCDAIECIYAPPTNEDEDGDIEMVQIVNDEDDMDGKEMLSIYSTLQPPFDNQITEGNNADKGDNDHENKQFILKCCEHKWHRKCLELSERSSGRFFNSLNDEENDNRIWVKCGKCRKDGWVPSSSKIKHDNIHNHEGDILDIDDEEYAPSEREVENLISF